MGSAFKISVVVQNGVTHRATRCPRDRSRDSFRRPAGGIPLDLAILRDQDCVISLVSRCYYLSPAASSEWAGFSQ